MLIIHYSLSIRVSRLPRLSRLTRLAWLTLHRLAIALHWLLAVTLHWLTVTLHWLAISLHWLSIALWLLSIRRHHRWHSAVAVLHGLAGLSRLSWLAHLSWLLHRGAISVHHLLLSRLSRLAGLSRLSEAWWGVGWRLAGSGCCVLYQVVLLKVTAELVVVDALLQLDKDVVQFHIELGSLLEEDGKLLLDDDGLVDLLEELVLGWVVTDLSYSGIQTG